MKKEAKDVGHEVLPDSGGAKATTGAQGLEEERSEIAIRGIEQK